MVVHAAYRSSRKNSGRHLFAVPAGLCLTYTTCMSHHIHTLGDKWCQSQSSTITCVIAWQMLLLHACQICRVFSEHLDLELRTVQTLRQGHSELVQQLQMPMAMLLCCS